MLRRITPVVSRLHSAQALTASRAYGAHEKPFDKILIANRGEIACRVMKTCKKLGVKTVAVYSEADAASMHVRMADEAYCIGTAASKDSYLRMDRILDVCKKTGAKAIHPGYGFLSENAAFVDMVEAAGLTFIGPSSAPMLSMGDKINSKIIAKNAGCFTIPGFDGEIESEDAAVKIAHEVGYPVMIKASAGGGGKGMRVAYTDAELREGYRLSKAEALSSFGDDRMLIERFIENPHHIEIQVLADTHGNVVAFPERECSVQRRNQKVVEESPSPYLLPETRKLMQQQAIQLCKATNYRSAGTVEMLADDKQNFFFLEMNTRLQVEHPITEMVTNEDLVEHMLWIAAGKPLPERLTKNPLLSYNGSAIESRVYAEDPTRKFLPSIGPLITYQEPRKFHTKEGSVRIDTGVYEGGVISMHYDPMISKLITHAPTRLGAIALQEQALDEYVVQGLGNNITFLRSVYRNKNFRDGNYCTKFIGEEYPNGFTRVELTPKENHQLIATAAAIHEAKIEYLRELNPVNHHHPIQQHVEEDYSIKDKVVVVLEGTKGKAFEVDVRIENELVAKITPLDEHDRPAGPTETVVVSELDWHSERPLGEVKFREEHTGDDEHRTVQYLGNTPEGFKIRLFGSEQEVIVRTPKEHQFSKHMLAPEVKDFSKFLVSPMPGTLISCSVHEGQHVEEGQQLAVVEAMKMQNVLKAEKSGVIKSVKKKAGQSLKVDEIIIEFE